LKTLDQWINAVMAFTAHWIDLVLAGCSRCANLVFSIFFDKQTEERHRWVAWTWLLVLFLGGLAAWGYFYSWGNFPLDFHDWTEVTAPRFAFLRDAVTRGLPPLHISDKMPLANATDRYLTIPDAFLSPQMFLLNFMDVGHFVLANLWLMYTVGFLGLLWLRKKFQLSGVAFTILFLLFNFNGHIVAHSSVGHATWGGYFLFPWFVALVLRLLDGYGSWKWVGMCAGLLFVMYLQGSFHQFVWCLLFLGFLALTGRKTFLPALGGAIFAIGISLVRIYPPTLMSSLFDHRYIGGYPDLTSIWEAMVQIQTPKMEVPFTNLVLGAWETTLYVGLVGAVFLLFFGVYRWLNPRFGKAAYIQLLLPIVATSLFSLGIAYGWLRDLVPQLLDGERAVCRIISLPFTFFLVVAVMEFQKWLDGPSLKSAVGRSSALTFMAIEVFDLARNFTVWRVADVAGAFSPMPFQAFRWLVANHPDPLYFRKLWLGGAGSVCTLALLLGMVFLEYHCARVKQRSKVEKQAAAATSGDFL
jgi:hypothetical protein